jgi:hypothetical protein
MFDRLDYRSTGVIRATPNTSTLLLTDLNRLGRSGLAVAEEFSSGNPIFPWRHQLIPPESKQNWQLAPWNSSQQLIPNLPMMIRDLYLPPDDKMKQPR